jgi:hypothetical protein
LEGSLIFRKVIGYLLSAFAGCGIALFIVINFAGLAAWSSYRDRGCPLEISADCDDAYTVSIFALVASPLSFLIVSILIWLAWRTFTSRLSNREIP